MSSHNGPQDAREPASNSEPAANSESSAGDPELLDVSSSKTQTTIFVACILDELTLTNQGPPAHDSLLLAGPRSRWFAVARWLACVLWTVV